MIITRKACKCALCNWEWLPSPTENNPKADPRKVKRCASCKSFQWNADDPKLLAARLAKVELPTVVTSYVETGPVEIRNGHRVPSTICRHRVLLAHCELCNAVPEARP
jgi:hypothetical protein